MNGGLPAALALSLALTLAFELGFALLAGKRNKKDLLLVVLVNVITNPAVVLLYWMAVFHSDWNHGIVKAVLELSALWLEGHYYKKYGQYFKHPYGFSAAANGLSFGMGLLFSKILREVL